MGICGRGRVAAATRNVDSPVMRKAHEMGLVPVGHICEVGEAQRGVSRIRPFLCPAKKGWPLRGPVQSPYAQDVFMQVR
jgi:hypothetical protein